MRKRNLFILSFAVLLALGACGGNKESKADPSSDGSMEQSESQPKDYSTFIDPDVELPDDKPADIQISFNQVSDNCMVSPKLKAYVDAMQAQGVTLEKPYHFSTLYGPDYAHNAAGSDKGDGVVYAAEDTGGVDVCQMLNRNDYSNKTENYPIELTWSNGSVTFESAKLKYWSKADKSDLKEVELSANATSAKLVNLFRATKYKVQLETSDGKASQGFEFRTGDYPRTISMGGIGNVRDEGGYVTSYGVRTNQGLIYRGMEIIDVSISGHSVNYSEAVEEANQKYMNILHEIDLKGDDNFNAGNKSCLKQADGTTPIKFSHLQVHAYDDFLKNSVTLSHLPDIFHIFANADQEPVYFHCWGGADRTGMVAFFLNAILGVSYTDLIQDFEITTETNNKRCHMHNSDNAHFPKFLNEFINKTDYGYDATKSVNKNCEQFLLKNGVAAADIEKIRSIMIPGYTTGMEEKIPTYTAKEGSIGSDDFAHWTQANEDDRVRFNYEPHKFVIDEEQSTIATCGEAGHEAKTCSVCGKKVSVDTPKKNHSLESKGSSTNSEGKTVNAYECSICHHKSYGIDVKDGTYVGGSIGSDGKMDKNITVTWKMPVSEQGKVIIQLPMKMSSSSHSSQSFSPSSYDIKVGGITQTSLLPSGTYGDIGLTMETVYFNFAEYTVTAEDVAAGEISIEFDHNASGYRLLFVGELRINY